MAEPQRHTKQRTEILDLLHDVEEFRSAQQLHAQLLARGAGVGLATVYRTLGAMAQVGEVDVLRTEQGESLYLRCAPLAARTHHHHLVCRVCGRTVDVAGPNLEEYVDTIGRGHGFVDVGHTLELYGTCAACAG